MTDAQRIDLTNKMIFTNQTFMVTGIEHDQGDDNVFLIREELDTAYRTAALLEEGGYQRVNIAFVSDIANN